MIPTEQVIPKSYAKGPEVTIPVWLLLDLHNALPAGNQTRIVIVDYICACASADQKAHWSRAVVRKEDDSLVFDEKLYEIAVYRGKQETRMEAGERAFAELRKQLDFLGAFYEEEKTLKMQISPEANPLMAMPEPSAALHHLRAHTDALKTLLWDMSCGLANTVAGTTERALLQRLEQESSGNDSKTEGEMTTELIEENCEHNITAMDCKPLA